MLKIAKSIFVVLAIVGLAAGATAAVFSSTATVDDNTFATGTLDVRIDGASSIAGFTASNMAPDDCQAGSFTVENYGLPWFVGPSTLPAKELVLSVTNPTGDAGLYNALTLDMTRQAGPTETVYSGPLNGLESPAEGNLLMSWLQGGAGLAAGNSVVIGYSVCLPHDASDPALQGKSTTFDFSVTGYDPHR